MYKEHFGLKEAPFSLAPDPRYLYLSERHQEALAHLLYGVKNDGGFVLLTGEVGTGKTTVCRCLLEKIPDHIDIAFVVNPKLNSLELLATICDELLIPYPDSVQSIKPLIDSLNKYLLDAHSKGRKTLLIIDEAQNLSSEVLEQIRLLTNLETNQQKLLQIIVLGQPELLKMLEQPELRQLSQRITARYHLEALDKSEIANYVRHRLLVAGLTSRIFPDQVIKKLFHLSKGIPRLINLLCDRSMLGAYVQDKDKIDLPIMATAAKEVFGAPDSKMDGPSYLGLKVVAACLILGCIGIGLYSYQVLFAEPGHSLYGTSSDSPPPQTKKPVKTPDQPAAVESRKLAPQLGTLSKPEGISAPQSRAIAYQELFNLWGIPFEEQRQSDFCKQARFENLECLAEKDSLSHLRILNRPAILSLYDPEQGEYFALLTALSENTATFLQDGKSVIIANADLALLWTGKYELLWQPPPGFTGPIREGHSSPIIPWLVARLGSIGKPLPENSSDVYDPPLISRIKELQFKSGLTPDGIAGAHTLICLNSATEPSLPRLDSDQRKF